MLQKISYVHAKQKQPRAVKKGAAMQSRINSIKWHSRWLLGARADLISVCGQVDQ